MKGNECGWKEEEPAKWGMGEGGLGFDGKSIGGFGSRFSVVEHRSAGRQQAGAFRCERWV